VQKEEKEGRAKAIGFLVLFDFFLHETKEKGKTRRLFFLL